MERVVGIMGGTFDPIHFGHLAAAEQARERFGLERVIFVPNGAPPHKIGYPITPAERRYEMVLLATVSNPRFEVSRVELDRPGPSYSLDTMRAFQQELGDDVKLYFITGVDAILEILTWHEPEQLVRACEFIAVTRPGYRVGRSLQELRDKLGARVHALAVPGVAISSTEIRARAAAGESLRYLTPTAVARYIAEHRLYSDIGACARAERGGARQPEEGRR